MIENLARTQGSGDGIGGYPSIGAPVVCTPACREGLFGAANQRARRAAILAAARQMIGEFGFDINVKAIAAKCGVAVQTLYNLVGNRNELLESAVLENITRMANLAKEQSQYPNPIFALADLNYYYILNNPSYIRSVAAECNPFAGMLYNKVQIKVTRIIFDMLNDMKNNGDFIHKADNFMIAEALASISAILTFEWATKSCQAESVRLRFASHGHSILRSHLNPRKVSALDAWLNSISQK